MAKIDPERQTDGEFLMAGSAKPGEAPCTHRAGVCAAVHTRGRARGRHIVNEREVIQHTRPLVFYSFPLVEMSFFF